jgi:DNA-binding transcriptional MocR family regulator
MSVAQQYRLTGRRASEIVASVEAAIRAGRLQPGAVLPPVRTLADELGVSPNTVAAAYRSLRERGLVSGARRRGTTVNHAPAQPVRTAPPLPAGARNLADGAPDRRLLPPLSAALRQLPTRPLLYDEPAALARLEELFGDELRADRVPMDELAVVGGAMDGIERVLGAYLRPGDRVAVEDPGYANLLDLIGALGLRAEPVALDEHGMRPEQLERAIGAGAAAVVITPRAQNPTGAALTATRAAALGKTLQAAPHVLGIEDDHASTVAGTPHHPCVVGQPRWAVVRSFSKVFGPDLRVAGVAGDGQTVARVASRHRLGAGWVSHLLQALVATLIEQDGTHRWRSIAAESYTGRRAELLAALRNAGIAAHGVSGLNVWVPVPDEPGTVARLLDAGWAVAAGERYRLQSPPGIRVTVATLEPGEAERFAADLARCLTPSRPHYTG